MVQDPVSVLLIEDNPGDIRLIQEMLIPETGEAYSVECADVLEAGIRWLRQARFDVVLLDLILPDSAGIDTLRQVIAAAPDTPIVVLTSFADRELGVETLVSGAQDYLVKGDTTGASLKRALRYAIERKRIEIADREHLTVMAALRDTLAALTSTLDLDEVLDRVLDNIGRVVPHHSSSVMLIEGETIRTVRARTQGATHPVSETAAPIANQPMLAEIAREGRPLQAAPGKNLRATDGTHGQAHLAVPILLEDEVTGIINVYRPLPFGDRDLERMQVFAEQAAIALRNARLYWQSSALAALEERQRLARDLHDSVSQTLFSASVVAEAALRSLKIDPSRIEPMLLRLHRLNSGALAEMRVLLLELRPAALESVALEDLLKQLIASARSRRKIHIGLRIFECPDMPLPIKEAIYRITQEALNNVLKHSRATRVEITLRCPGDDSPIDLVIQDNGIGFDPAAQKAASMGVLIMQERTEGLGGSFSMESQDGQGVRIHASIPKAHLRREQQ